MFSIHCLATFFYSEVDCEAGRIVIRVSKVLAEELRSRSKNVEETLFWNFLTSTVLASRGKATRKAALPPIL